MWTSPAVWTFPTRSKVFPNVDTEPYTYIDYFYSLRQIHCQILITLGMCELFLPFEPDWRFVRMSILNPIHIFSIFPSKGEGRRVVFVFLQLWGPRKDDWQLAALLIITCWIHPQLGRSIFLKFSSTYCSKLEMGRRLEGPVPMTHLPYKFIKELMIKSLYVRKLLNKSYKFFNTRRGIID